MKKTFLLPIIIAIALSFGIGVYVGQVNRPSVEKLELLTNPELGKPTGVDFSLFWDTWKIVEEKYVDRLKLNPQEMIYGAISGMLRALGDPYTLFLPPQETKKFKEDMQGSFEGIGAEISIRKGVLIIIAPLEGSPAKRAGLLPQDKILKINETAASDLNIDEAVNLIRGPKETEVKLLILRDEWSEPKEIKITREAIQIPVLKWELKDSNIAYIQFYHFTENASFEFQKTVQEILASNAKSIILDLRNNPGGYLETSVDIASWFLPKNEIVAIEDFGNDKKIEYRSKGYLKLANFPLVVLVNSGSASASEIVAGALRDIRGIKLVGEKTFGKGSVQEMEQLASGSSLKITIAKWLTPSGKSIMEEGLEPDIKIEMTKEDFDANRDPQLDKALEMLK